MFNNASPFQGSKNKSNEASLINVYFAISLPVMLLDVLYQPQSLSNNNLPRIYYLFVKAQRLCKMENNVLFAKIVPQSLSFLACNVLLTTIDCGLTITHLILMFCNLL